MIRPATTADLPSILALLDAAFAPSRYESRLVELAMQTPDRTRHGWVMEHEEEDEAIIGYVLYTEATRNLEKIGYHLAPVAIAPEKQKTGAGSELIRRTLEEEAIAGAPVFVLGDPGFYERFGFKPVLKARCPYDESNEHFRALRWKDEGEEFVVGYDVIFTAVQG